ncbi:acyltransferase family protein [Rhizocola hellebori]|nr:acyltransferase family protein [Rhizocola hellebori]
MEFRGDIEGMRAIAVLLVVIGHASVGLFSGGFVGVDVFFVISGFLITSLLTQELTATGTISIRQFYTRRALRLLPASTLVLLVTLIAAWSWLSPLRFTETVKDIVASAFYVINFRLAGIGTDYWAASDPPSPVQHFWSLAVEEQFYMFWPVLILLATLWSRRRGQTRLGPLTVVLATLTAGSLALSWLVTHQSAPWAYFGGHTRAWELGIGALVALGATRFARLPRVAAELAAWIGLGAIITAAVVFDEFTPFPGIAALLPVAGAALVIAAGFRSSSAGRLLGLGPMRVLGKLSYGWYLWHWPMLLIVPVAFDMSPSLADRLALAGAALLLAQLSLVAVENPIRHLSALRHRPLRGIGLGLTLSSTTTAVALSMVVLMPPGAPGLVSPDRALFIPPAIQLDVIDDLPSGAPEVLPSASASAAPAPSMDALLAQGLNMKSLPRNLDPPLASASKAYPSTYNGCHRGFAGVSLPPDSCVFGDTSSPTTVVLLGDSHAAQWFSALEKLAKAKHWRLIPLTKANCPVGEVQVIERSFNRTYTECEQWRANAMAKIASLHPALVVTATYFDSRQPVPASSNPEAVWAEGWKRSFIKLKASAAHVVFMVDNLYRFTAGPECAAVHPDSLSACNQASTSGGLMQPTRRANVAKVAVDLGVTVIDPIPWMCLNNKCPLVVGNILTYRDNHHITPPFSRLLAPMLEAKLPALTP